MGRKIPGKKHRKVKDPYKQQQRRLDRLKLDNPPSKSGEQEIPKSLLRIMELKTEAKQTVTKKNKGKSKRPPLLSVAKLLEKEPLPKGIKKPDKFIPKLVQKPNESAQGFLRRLDTLTQNLINEVEFEKKFGVEIKKDSITGNVIEVKKLKKERKSKKKKLSEKRKEKLNEKKESLKNIKDFSQLKDKVEFGETVHRPPDFSKMKANKNKIQKPKYSNLFLNNVVEELGTKNKNEHKNFEKEKKENERKFIVEAYRRIKGRKSTEPL